MKKQRLYGVTLPVACIVGVLVSQAVILIGNLIFAICISNEYCELSCLKIIAIIVQFTGTFAGTRVAASGVPEKKILTSIITGTAGFGIQLCSALLFFDGISAHFLCGIIAAVAASLCSIFFVKKGKRRSASRKKRNPYR